mgnify:CR=1 FL=1
MPKPFEIELNALLSLIKEYQITLKTTKQKTPQQLAYFDNLKAIYQMLQVALKQQEIDNCTIVLSVLAPYEQKSFLPKKVTQEKRQ